MFYTTYNFLFFLFIYLFFFFDHNLTIAYLQQNIVIIVTKEVFVVPIPEISGISEII